jgi:hypothetical protein
MTDQLGTPRKGVMNIAASFPSVVKPRLSIQEEKAKLKKVMLASLVTLQQRQKT